MKDGGAFGVFLCVMVFAIALGTLIGAVFLRAACSLYNRLAGGKYSPSRVPEPLLGKAMGIVLVTSLANAFVGFLFGLAVGAGGVVAGVDQNVSVVIAQLLSLPISLLVMAAMNAALLPTTFARGLLVALCYLLVVLLVVVVLGIVFGGIFLIFTLLR